MGLLGGALGALAVGHISPSPPPSSQQVVLEESSAITGVVEKLSPSVVNIQTSQTTLDAFGQPTESISGQGSGIIISSSGLILTNKHVVGESSAGISIITSDGREFKNAKVLARDPLNDLAYLKVNASGLSAAQLGDSDRAQVGQRVVAIGNALGEFSNTVTSGIVSGVGRPISASNGNFETELLDGLIQTDAAINPGNSGGPLVNIQGQVIGINTAVAGNAENIGFAIPVNQAKSGIASIEKSGRLVKPFLGVRFVPLDAEVAARDKLPVTAGAWLKSRGSQPAIIPRSPAAKASLKEGDIITHLNGEPINAQRSLTTLIGQHQAGDTVELTVRRGPEELKISVQLVPLEEN